MMSDFMEEHPDVTGATLAVAHAGKIVYSREPGMGRTEDVYLLKGFSMNVRTFSLALLLALAGLVFFLAPSSVWTQPEEAKSKRKSPVSQKLYDEIAHMDRVLFDAFNARDLERIKTLFTEDLE